MRLIMGIDPGKQTGIAVFIGGALSSLETIAQGEIIGKIRQIAPDKVIFEDSRLQTTVFGRKTNGKSLLKIARDVGRIDAWCEIIADTCLDMGIMGIGISPKEKGTKLTAEDFNAFTGWTGKSNQHERDAACVAWRYKGMA